MSKTVPLFLLIALTFVACAPAPVEPGAATSTSVPTPAGTATVVERTGPAITTWEFAENPHVERDGARLAFHWFELSNTSTRLVYSLYPAGAPLLHERALELVGDRGENRALAQIVPLAQFGSLEVGVLRFGPRHPYTQALRLRFAGELEEMELIAAEGRPDELDYGSRYYGQVESVQQEEYQIRFAGYFLQRAEENSNTSTAELATRAPAIPVAPLPAGKAVRVSREISLQIKPATRGETQTLGIQLLEDGRIISIVEGEGTLARATVAPPLYSTPDAYAPYPPQAQEPTPYPAP